MSMVTWLDLVVVIIVILFVVRGAWIGFIRQLAAFLALVGSYVIAARYVALALPVAQNFVDNPKIVFLLSFALLFVGSAALFSLAGKLLHKLIQIILLGWFDRFLGITLGLLKAALVCSLLYMVLASTLSSTSTVLSKSVCGPVLKEGAKILQQLIHDPKVRDYFKENTPAIPLDMLIPGNKADQKTGNKEAGDKATPANDAKNAADKKGAAATKNEATAPEKSDK